MTAVTRLESERFEQEKEKFNIRMTKLEKEEEKEESEITNDNIHHIKELLKIVDELRHGGITVSETECMATTILQEATTLTQIIYSNNKAFVEQMQYIFDVFWYRAIPARQKIREIGEGIKREYKPFKILLI